MSPLAIAVPAANGQGAAQDFYGGWATVACFGTFNSGTVTLQVSYNNGTTYFTCPDSLGDDVIFAANGMRTIALGGSPKLRASLSGSSGATAVTLELHGGFSGVRRAHV